MRGGLRCFEGREVEVERRVNVIRGRTEVRREEIHLEQWKGGRRVRGVRAARWTERDKIVLREDGKKVWSDEEIREREERTGERRGGRVEGR